MNKVVLYLKLNTSRDSALSGMRNMCTVWAVGVVPQNSTSTSIILGCTSIFLQILTEFESKIVKICEFLTGPVWFTMNDIK